MRRVSRTPSWAATASTWADSRLLGLDQQPADFAFRKRHGAGDIDAAHVEHHGRRLHHLAFLIGRAGQGRDIAIAGGIDHAPRQDRLAPALVLHHHAADRAVAHQGFHHDGMQQDLHPGFLQPAVEFQLETSWSIWKRWRYL